MNLSFKFFPSEEKLWSNSFIPLVLYNTGCGESLSLSGEKLRSDSMATLTKIVESQEQAAESWVTNYARLDPVEDIVDLLHALLGFCEDPESMSDDDEEEKPVKTGLFSTKAGVEGKVVGFLLKRLVSRNADMSLQSLASLVRAFNPFNPS